MKKAKRKTSGTWNCLFTFKQHSALAAAVRFFLTCCVPFTTDEEVVVSLKMSFECAK